MVQTKYILSFPGGSAGKEFVCSVGDLGSIPGLGRTPGERNGYPFQYFAVENSMDCIVHGVENSQTQLSDFHFHRNYTSPKEKLKINSYYLFSKMTEKEALESSTCSPTPPHEHTDSETFQAQVSFVRNPESH